MNKQQLITLGKWHEYFRNPNGMRRKDVNTNIEQYLKSIRACGMNQTLIVAKALSDLKWTYYIRWQTLTKESARDIRRLRDAIDNTLQVEAHRSKIVVKNTGFVIPEIRGLSRTINLNEIQKALLKETIFCLETKAFRAAIVMAWNFAFDYMRFSIFTNHKRAFNIALGKNYKKRNGDRQYQSINKYEDFYSGILSERVTIDTWYHARKINGKQRDHLRELLRTRNNHAHPKFTKPSAGQSNAYVKDLVDIIQLPIFSQRTNLRTIPEEQ